MENLQIEEEKIIEEKPPVLSNWNQLYAIVLINLALLIVLFYIFTKTFS